jgi:hypothetical protein
MKKSYVSSPSRHLRQGPRPGWRHRSLRRSSPLLRRPARELGPVGGTTPDLARQGAVEARAPLLPWEAGREGPRRRLRRESSQSGLAPLVEGGEGPHCLASLLLLLSIENGREEREGSGDWRGRLLGPPHEDAGSTDRRVQHNIATDASVTRSL